MIAVQFLNSDEELLLDAELDVQDPIASNADSAQETFEDEIVSVPNEARAAEQRNAELGNSSKATNDGGVQLSKISPDKQGGSEDVENQSPNSSEKRGSSDSVQLHKSSKKHASTEMKFRCFKINWDKLGDSLLNRLRTLEDFKRNNRGVPVPVTIRIAKTEVTTLANTVVDQLRMIDTQIRSDVMETAARQVLDKFPALDYTDDDGFGAGQGYVDIKYKLINRNNYLNRFKSPQATLTNTVTSLKKKRNARAGTLKEYWQKSASECDKSSVSALVRDDPSLMTEELLLKTQAFIRWKLDEKIDTKKMISQLPVLRRRLLVNFHFEQATGVNITDLRRYFMMKREKIVQYSLTCKSELHLSKSASDYDILKFLCSLVGEDFGDFIIQKDIGTRIDDITIDGSGPVLVAVDVGNDKTIFYVYANRTRLSEGAHDVIAAVEDLFAIQFVHNFMYTKSVSKFMELLQEYFLKIITFVASKSGARRKFLDEILEECLHEFLEVSREFLEQFLEKSLQKPKEESLEECLEIFLEECVGDYLGEFLEDSLKCGTYEGMKFKDGNTSIEYERVEAQGMQAERARMQEGNQSFEFVEISNSGDRKRDNQPSNNNRSLRQ
ncbi:hypothetical protein RP20_CCG015064 [Aedes albopictus]|nr:hypothetical protein RP20_CCG015064 [Aedes albopictus]